MEDAYPNHLDDYIEMEIRQYQKFGEKPSGKFFDVRRNLGDTKSKGQKKERKWRNANSSKYKSTLQSIDLSRLWKEL